MSLTQWIKPNGENQICKISDDDKKLPDKLNIGDMVKQSLGKNNGPSIGNVNNIGNNNNYSGQVNTLENTLNSNNSHHEANNNKSDKFELGLDFNFLKK
ncbi:hypothetical protein PVAND_016325 [Polypedilum vanderplanki]|uniref:Uncharacterized protein n=1 Tax=Polypedilum vanderplanki TaxID=319348 RepID=A0A9J6BES8_POLVA|nr:hypothetical protein PVAND_016325 [Polypedilum vanderplanki]